MQVCRFVTGVLTYGKSLCSRIYAFRGINCVVNFHPVCLFCGRFLLSLDTWRKEKTTNQRESLANRVSLPELSHVLQTCSWHSPTFGETLDSRFRRSQYYYLFGIIFCRFSHPFASADIPNYPTGKEAVISFELTLAELDANGVSPEDICLYYFDKETGVWTKLATTYKVVGDKSIYEAVTTGFSPFSIVFEKGAATPAAGADDPVTPPTETPDVPDTPVTPQQPTDKPDEPETPAPILAVLAGLGAAAVLRRK